MIRKAEDMNCEIKQNMRDGDGSAELFYAFANEEMTSKTRLCAKIVLNKGCSIGPHTHADEDEIYYILEGEGIVNEGDGEHPVKKGDAVLTGNGGTHSIKNPFDKPLELLAVVVKY